MYSNKYTSTAFIAFLALPRAFAQVTTSCQPLNSTCPDDLGLTVNNYFVDFTTVNSLPSDWSVASYETVNFGPNGAELTFAKRFDAPLIRTNFNFFFGSVEYVVQGAPGKGIVSSMVLLSDDLDEIDWEMTGTGGSQIETNYYGKGVPDYNNYQYVNVTTPQTEYHTYGLQWSSEALVWYIDDVVVRTLTAAQAGDYFPQTPMHVSLSLWDGGDPTEAPGTQNWAGGETTFPITENYTMYIKSVKINNAMPGGGYQYTDMSGSWQSIRVLSNTTNGASNLTSATNTSSMAPNSTIYTANKPAPFGLAYTTQYSNLASSINSIATAASLMNTKATAPVASLPILNSTASLYPNSSMAAGATVSLFPVPSVSAPSGLIQANKEISAMTTPANTTSVASTALSLSTQESVTTEVVYTTLTSCPVTQTITSNGTPTEQITTQVSTIIRTSTSTICTRCVAPVSTPSTTPVASGSPSSSGSSASPASQASASSPPPAKVESLASSPLYTKLAIPASSPPPSQSPISNPSSTTTMSPAVTTAQEHVTSEIVYTTLTTCPVTNTITPPSGTPILHVTTSVSTILSTSTSTVCTKCVAPVASISNAIYTSSSVSPSSSSTPSSNASLLSPQVSSTLLKALTGHSADASVASNLYYSSSQPAVVEGASIKSTNMTPTPLMTGTSSVTPSSTTINSSANSMVPSGLFAPISASALSASASGTATITSSITMGETLTMTSYGVSATGSGPGAMNGTNNGTAAATPSPFKGPASKNTSPTAFLALLLAAIAALSIL